MAKVKKGVKKFQKKIAGGGVHKKKKLHFRRDKADAAKAAEVREQSAAANEKKSGALACAHCCRRASQLRSHPHRQSQLYQGSWSAAFPASACHAVCSAATLLVSFAQTQSTTMTR